MIPELVTHILVEDLSSERNTSSDGGTFITISEGIMKNENISMDKSFDFIYEIEKLIVRLSMNMNIL